MKFVFYMYLNGMLVLFLFRFSQVWEMLETILCHWPMLKKKSKFYVNVLRKPSVMVYLSLSFAICINHCDLCLLLFCCYPFGFSIVRAHAGVSLMDKGNWFSQAGKMFWTELLNSRKNFRLDGQTRQAKSSSQPVNLLSSWPLMEPLTY